MASDAPTVGTLVANLAKHAEILVAAAEVKVSGEPLETDAPVREMLQRAGELVRGAAVLGEQLNPVALGVLSRAILENLILMLWVQVDPRNATDLKETALAELTRVARINFEKGKARLVNRHTGEDATPEFLNSGRFKNLKKRASVETRAKETGVEDLYTVFYRFMSLDLHGSGLGGRSENGESTSIVHMQGIGALAMASGHVGVRWLVHRQRTDNEVLRDLLGIGRPSANK